MIKIPFQRATKGLKVSHEFVKGWNKKIEPFPFKRSPDGNLLQPDLLSPPFKRHRAAAAECPDVGSGDDRDVHAAAGRNCASQPPPTSLRKTSSTSMTAENDSKFDRDVFGGFTQPAQVFERLFIRKYIFAVFW